LSAIAFACIAGGVLLGFFLRNTLPEHHLSSESKDVARLGPALVGTIAALVLGLLIGSAKSSYDTQNAQIKQMTANIVLLEPLPAAVWAGGESSAQSDAARRRCPGGPNVA
jgi:hypothetical protein